MHTKIDITAKYSQQRHVRNLDSSQFINVICSDGVSRLGHGLKILHSHGKNGSLENGFSQKCKIARNFASFGLEAFTSRLGLEGYRSRDFEYCKEMVQ